MKTPLAVIAIAMAIATGAIFVPVKSHYDVAIADKKEECAVDCMKNKALAGDKKSARDLSLIYAKIDFDSMQYWNLIGAENGDATSQYNYAFWLLEKGSPQEKRRAMFWLRKAAASNDEDAKDLIRRLTREAP